MDGTGTLMVVNLLTDGLGGQMKFLGKDPNSSEGNSPTIWEDGDSYVVQGWRITEAGSLAAIGDVPAHETVVRIPKHMVKFFPEVAGGSNAHS
jgi:hypothetical protein